MSIIEFLRQNYIVDSILSVVKILSKNLESFTKFLYILSLILDIIQSIFHFIEFILNTFVKFNVNNRVLIEIFLHRNESNFDILNMSDRLFNVFVEISLNDVHVFFNFDYFINDHTFSNSIFQIQVVKLIFKYHFLNENKKNFFVKRKT